MTAPPPEHHARVAYDALAAAYDDFTAHHDYDGWTATIERLARSHGLRGRGLLDVACGTGKSFAPFAARGYSVVACDVSPEMVRQAADRAGSDVRVLVHDMRALPRLGAFDLVCCLDDALNYLLTADELGSALAGMAANLAPGGRLVFDLNTVGTYRQVFGGLHVVAREDRVVVWTGHAAPTFAPGEVASATAEAYERDTDGTWSRRAGTHHQRHHPQPLVEAALRAAGLTCCGVYGMRFDGSTEAGFGELRNSKVVYVAGPDAG